jgi:SAM-dependent methyltransferase
MMLSKEYSFENYVEKLQLEQLFKRLEVPNPELLAKEVKYFSIKEARKRDRIVVGYFGKSGTSQIVDCIYEFLLSPPKLAANADVLDVGVGTGYFTVKIYRKIRRKLPKVCFYAMDATPAMLIALKKKRVGIVPFLGVAENIEGSIKEARKYFSIPRKFDAAFSTLMLHHSVEPEKVFESIKKVLKKGGKAIVIDLCKHEFEEFKTEMGDIHTGFNTEDVYEMSRKSFPKVHIRKMKGIRCECSGRSAQIFAAFLHNDSQSNDNQNV